MSKTKIAKYLSVFMPTLSGQILYVFLAGAAIVLNQFELVRGYLQLPHDLRLTRQIAQWADTLLTNTIGTEWTQTLVVGLFWAVVGMGVYIFLRGLAQIFIELDDNLEARRYIWPRGSNRQQPLREQAEQVAFRAAAFVGLLLVVFVTLPSLLRGPILVDFLGSSQVLQYIVWFAAGVLVWHSIVVLMRLVALRSRLFG